MTIKKIASIIVGVVILVCAVLFIIGGSSKNELPMSTVTVSSVVPASDASGVSLVISGSHAGCDTIRNWHQEVRGQLITITPVLVRLAEGSCQEVISYTETLAVAVGDLPAGVYSVDVGGVVVDTTVQEPAATPLTPVETFPL